MTTGKTTQRLSIEARACPTPPQTPRPNPGTARLQPALPLLRSPDASLPLHLHRRHLRREPPPILLPPVEPPRAVVALLPGDTGELRQPEVPDVVGEPPCAIAQQDPDHARDGPEVADLGQSTTGVADGARLHFRGSLEVVEQDVLCPAAVLPG